MRHCAGGAEGREGDSRDEEHVEGGLVAKGGQTKQQRDEGVGKGRGDEPFCAREDEDMAVELVEGEVADEMGDVGNGMLGDGGEEESVGV